MVWQSYWVTITLKAKRIAELECELKEAVNTKDKALTGSAHEVKREYFNLSDE